MALRTRDATRADYAVYARLFPELAVPDPVLSEERFVVEMLPRTVVVEDGGVALGYGHYRVYGDLAHVVHVVADPRARGRGVGRALMQALREGAAREGCARVYLNVKKQNAPAIRLYERSGLAVEYGSWPLRAEWSSLLALEGPSARAYVAPAEEDRLVEERFGFPAARIALSRTRPHAVVMAVADGSDGPDAIAAFEPLVPGVYPIACRRLELARALFAALHPHAHDGFVYVTVERDQALADLLRRAGAQLLFEIVRMGGEI
jgi:ribosomal-protein-alanine N-acetyltransferase